MKKATGRKDKADALVIVDVQQAFTMPKKIVKGIRRHARKFPLRVFTQFVNPPGSLFREKLDQRSCAPGSADLRLLIEPGPGDLVFRKAGYGLKPAAIRRLKAAGVKKVEVCGVDTDACVLGVMYSLFDAGISCHAKEDLCWSSTGLHKQAMKIIREQFPEPR